MNEFFKIQHVHRCHSSLKKKPLHLWKTCMFLVFPLGMEAFHASLPPGTSSLPRDRVAEKNKQTLKLSLKKLYNSPHQVQGEESLTRGRKPKGPGELWAKVLSFPNPGSET